MPEFQSFGKIPRLTNLKMVVTEKIDGTNACVVVDEDGTVSAQSRKRVITPEDDNFGFAAWVRDNADELRTLGPGYHFGEWYGKGIQRGYRLEERHFALFNVSRWGKERPSCCGVVPVLYEGDFQQELINYWQQHVERHGSLVNPNWSVGAEGVMVFVSPLNVYIKHPIDPHPKGVQ